MDLEVSKSHDTETSHVQRESYSIRPTYCLNYMHIINVEGVANVGVSQIKQLAKKLSLNDVYPQIAKFSNDQFQKLTEKLLTIKDTEFLYTLCNIIFMCSDEGVDVLRQCGVNINKEHQGEKVATAYSSTPTEFEIALDRLLFKSVTTDKTYHLFNSKGQIIEMENPRIAIQEIENECKEYFKISNYGEFCRLRPIYPIEVDKRLGFFIEHAGNLKSKPVINTQDKVSLFHGRNLIGDFAIYDPSLNLILISSRSATHCGFYSKIMGKAFWNNESLFNTQIQLDLSFVNEADVQQNLENCQNDKIMSVQIKKIHIVTNDMDNSKVTLSIRRGCLIRNKKNLVKGDIAEVELALKLNINGKNKLQRLKLRATSIKCGPLVFQSDVQHIFKQLKLIQNEKN